MKEDYLRVTDILQPFTGYGGINKNILQAAKDRGTKIHEFADAFLNNLGVWDPLPIHKGYVDSFLKFLGKGIDIVVTETRFYNDKYKITGCCDVIIKEPDGLTLIDWKTSYSPNRTWHAQGSAYSWLAKQDGYDIAKIKFVKLKKDGEYPLVYEYKEDFDEFLKCYDLYHKYFHNLKTFDLLD